MQEITLRAMRFHSLVGILEHERTSPQPVEMDVTVRVAAEGGASIVDYRDLYDVAAASLSSHTEFLEQIADRVASRCLALNSAIRSVRVAVRKPRVALPGPLTYAEVVVERDAENSTGHQ